MRGWEWLTNLHYDWRMILRVVGKATLLFALTNIVFALLYPASLAAVMRTSIYNGLVPGRARFPYGASPDSYNVLITHLDALFSSHEIARPKAGDEYRVIVLGDSAAWGYLLDPDQTTSAQLNTLNLTVNGRRVVAYNLALVETSVTKDLLILEEALAYQPDLIVWRVTARTFTDEENGENVYLTENPERVRALANQYNLALDQSRYPLPSIWENTLIARRQDLADWLRLQLYGIAWANTGIDQANIPYTPRVEVPLESSEAYDQYAEPVTLTAIDLRLDRISAAHTLTDVPILLVNEPMYIGSGDNADARYNEFYPRWAYDQYRALLAVSAAQNGWNYLDLWNTIAPVEFTDSPLHLTPVGETQLAALLASTLLDVADGRLDTIQQGSEP